MKKFKILKYALVATLFVGFTGCDSLLNEVEPSTSVSAEVVLTSEEGVDALRASMYSKIHESFDFTTEYFVAPSAFTDETRNRPGSTRFQALTLATGTSGGTTHLDNWGLYEIIQDANLIIGAVEPDVFDDPATLDLYRGEALTLRAFAMHTMVRVYGYEPGNFGQGELEANWDAGIIIRTEPTLDLSDADLRPRSSVDDVYTQILNDLSTAKTLLSGVNSDNRYVTEAFVDGLTARVNLYAGNWAEAATAAQNAINNFPGALETTATGVANMFDENEGNHPEALFKIVINPDTEGGGFGNNGPATYTADGFLAQLPTQFLIDKYAAGDHRLGWYEDCTTTQLNPLTSPTGCDQVNTNGWAIVKFGGEKGNSVDDMPMMRLSEMYLIRAEALAKDANSPAAGVTPLQTLRDARNTGAVPAAALADLQAFEDEILDERMRELGVEGHRFFDLKRLGRDIRNPDGSIKMRADSYRILAGLGSGLLNVNDQLVENPGYE
ncbi:MAG: RagB/SusD family nutrient uptake outer membrane protein [Gracilimonas sp.]|uniref:RagB/SusD family nutrient uptake outer membrane protein n=1 Tax=Gracilimonas sp. TaxID=1974203 RepID=UPI0019A50C24|nr:RagB/SusD family nutrient uptake outer membrane protein [Gracilimonas sp.]MBD3616390.1 RagB/SusD family nutrient uptake outer membrane protein [Gracilimonas sp.]